MGASTICFIAGDDSIARSVYTQERFGYFSSAFDTILEKHGILDFCRATPDVLDRPGDLRRYPILLIAWMPLRFWKLSYLRSLWEYDGVVMLEGPFPEFLDGYVGVDRISGIRGHAGYLEWHDPEMEESIREHLQALMGNEKRIPIEPKMVITRPMPQPRRKPWNIRLGFQSQTPGMSEVTSEHTKRWAAPPYWIEPYIARGAEVLATMVLADGSETAVVVRQGRVLAITFQALSYLAHFHTMHPLKEPLFACETRPAIALEKLLINQMVRHAALYDAPILQVTPWPDGKQFALTVRHDVDRIPPPNKVREIFEVQQGRALRGTWCWIADRLDARLIRTIESEGDEVALHAFSLGRKQEEVSALRSLVSKQEEIIGETIHGGGGSGWLGAPSVVGALEAGFRYTEFLPLQLLPTRFLILESDGKVHRLDEPICLSFSGSVDPEIVRKRFTVWGEDPAHQRVVCSGGYLLLLTHPDFPTDRLEKALDSLPITSGQGMTCAEVTAWWNATHSQKSLQIERVAGADEPRFRLKTAQVIRGLTLRVASPMDLDAGETGGMYQPGQVVLNLEPNTPVTVVVKGHRYPSYEEIMRFIPPELQGKNLDPGYQLPRADKLIQVLKAYTPQKSLRRARIIDVGCGYGPVTIATFLLERPAELIGIDISDQYVKIANMLVEKARLEGIRFVRGDMKEVTRYAQDGDVLIVNNCINFLMTRREYRQAIAQFYKALKPSGAVVILTPNRLYYREAFTKLVGVQFLPKKLANWYVRWRGRRETYTDIRLPSPFELRRWLWRAGFEGVRVIDTYRLQDKGWLRYLRPRFYLVATKPPVSQ